MRTVFIPFAWSTRKGRAKIRSRPVAAAVPAAKAQPIAAGIRNEPGSRRARRNQPRHGRDPGGDAGSGGMALLFAFDLELAVERGHADAEDAGRLLPRAFEF